jgi:hypothetical protein
MIANLQQLAITTKWRDRFRAELEAHRADPKRDPNDLLQAGYEQALISMTAELTADIDAFEARISGDPPPTPEGAQGSYG